MSTRHVVNMRPQGQPDAPVYSPHRDLGNLYPSAMREAVRSLDADAQPEYLKEFLRQNNVDENALGVAVGQLVDAHRLFVGDPTIKEPADAFRQTGFLDAPWPARMAIFERLGEVMMGGFFIALRDVTRQGDIPPQAQDIAEMIAASRRLMQKLGALMTPHLPNLTEEFEKYQAFWQEGQRVLGNLRSEVFAANNAAVVAAKEAKAYAAKVNSQSWWARLKYLFTGKIL